MEVANEISLKIKTAIKAKLIELGVFIGEEELPDYIMVMVANKRSEEQMTDDLCLFLGDSTEIFTSWLHGLLARLQSVASEPISVMVKPLPSTEGVSECQSPHSSVSASDNDSVSTNSSTKVLPPTCKGDTRSRNSGSTVIKTKTLLVKKQSAHAASSYDTPKCSEKTKSASAPDPLIRIKPKPVPPEGKKPSGKSETGVLPSDSVSDSHSISASESKLRNEEHSHKLKTTSPKKVTVVKTKVKCVADSQGTVEASKGKSVSSESEPVAKGTTKGVNQKGLSSDSESAVKLKKEDSDNAKRKGVPGDSSLTVKGVHKDNVKLNSVSSDFESEPAVKSKKIDNDNARQKSVSMDFSLSVKGVHKGDGTPKSVSSDSKKIIKVKVKGATPSGEKPSTKSALSGSASTSDRNPTVSTVAPKKLIVTKLKSGSSDTDKHSQHSSGSNNETTTTSKVQPVGSTNSQGVQKHNKKRKGSDPEPAVVPNKLSKSKESVAKKKEATSDRSAKQKVSGTKVVAVSQNVSKVRTASTKTSEACVTEKHSNQRVSTATKTDNRKAHDLKKRANSVSAVLELLWRLIHCERIVLNNGDVSFGAGTIYTLRRLG